MIRASKILILFSTLSFFLSEEANWVLKRPINQAYFIGIGMVNKSNSTNHIQSAKNNALNDLSSEISVNISSEIVDIMIEQSGMSEEESRSEIHASTKADLEEYELVDTWENDYEYWVYYRLSKAKYQANIELKRQNAISLSLDLFKKAKALGNKLIVGVITDEGVKKYKREPIIPFEQRIEIISSIKAFLRLNLECKQLV